MDQSPGLIVRRSARHDTALRAQITVAPEHAGLVRLNAGASKSGAADGDMVDFGAGGVGIVTGVFLPRKCVLRLRVAHPVRADEVLLDVFVRVQRTIMTDRRPAYLVGASFEKPTPEQAAQIEAMIRRLEEPGVERAG